MMQAFSKYKYTHELQTVSSVNIYESSKYARVDRTKFAQF